MSYAGCNHFPLKPPPHCRLGAAISAPASPWPSTQPGCWLCCGIAALRGSSSQFCAFPPDLHETVSIILDLDLGYMAQGRWRLSLPTFRLATGAVIEFSILLGGWSPLCQDRLFGILALATHWLEFKLKSCTSVLLFS